jgi:hypothetical protein
VTELYDSQGNRLNWQEEIPFDVYYYPGGNHWFQEVLGPMVYNDWYLEPGNEVITMHCFANWEHQLWNFNTNQWERENFGNLEDIDSSDFVVEYGLGG